jgi:hypothetical protein
MRSAATAREQLCALASIARVRLPRGITTLTFQHGAGRAQNTILLAGLMRCSPDEVAAIEE